MTSTWTPCNLEEQNPSLGEMRYSSFLFITGAFRQVTKLSRFLGLFGVHKAGVSRLCMGQRGLLGVFSHQPQALLPAAQRALQRQKPASSSSSSSSSRPARRVLPRQFRDAARGSAGCRSCYLSKEAARSASSGFPLCPRCPPQVAGCPRERSLLVRTVACLAVSLRLKGIFQDPFSSFWSRITALAMCNK